MKIVKQSNLPEQVWERVKQERDELETGPFLYDGVLYDGDRVSVQRIIGSVVEALICAQLGQPFSVTWTAADNSTVVLDGQKMLGLGLALGGHVKTVFDQARAAREKIARTKTADTLEKIKLVAPQAKAQARKANTGTPQ